MTLSVEMLPAKYGDALLVTWGTPSAPHRMLIDGGLSSAYPACASRLRELDGDIDLFVVTHVDTDHIGGAVKLLRDEELSRRFRAVWFNGFRHLERFNDLLGPLDGERLSALITELGVPWNEGWPDPVDERSGGPVVWRDEPCVVELPGGATATLVSPTPQKLADLLPVWREVIERAGLVPHVPATPDPEDPGRGMLGVTLTDLAETRFQRDDAEANGSSIAFVFEYAGRRILFAGDAHEDALLAALGRLSPGGGRYRLDACKLPHHGSRRNVSKALVQALDCDQWWFSSNGVRFGHPNDEALARVVRFGGRTPKLVGNYRSDRWRDFTTAFPPDEHGYELVLPTDGTEGVTISFDEGGMMGTDDRPLEPMVDDAPLFELDEMHEPDVADDLLGERGVDVEGVSIPFDVLEFGNGRLPDAALQPIGIGAHRLHATAAEAFARWRELAAAAGIDLTCTDSYRTLDQQIELKQRKPEWSATPGRSVHGWGFAVDVSVGWPPKAFGTTVLRWLEENGPPNGWFLGRPRDEPWHWVYRGPGGGSGAPSDRGAVAAAATTRARAARADSVVGSAEIALGASGAAVRSLRLLLGLAPADTFDAETDAAARAFQEAHGLAVDGRVGPRTWASLRSATAPADRPELVRGTEHDAVRWVQRRLALTVDGDFGPRTEAAVKAFQRASGLADDGRVGPRTWAALMA